MEINNYQKLAMRTFLGRVDFEISPEDLSIIWHSLGLAGEAGEIVEAVKKGIFHQHGLDKEKIEKELGDVCWYIAALCTNLNINMEEVMATNIEKLKIRYPEGYNTTDSIERIDTQK